MWSLALEKKERYRYSMSAKIEKQMQKCANNLGLPLNICWRPDNSKAVHGEIKNNTIFLYDVEEEEAWRTLTHELTEYKLQSVTRPYRLMINSLIEAFEKSVYAQKEGFIEFLPKIFEVTKKTKGEIIE